MTDETIRARLEERDARHILIDLSEHVTSSPDDYPRGAADALDIAIGALEAGKVPYPVEIEPERVLRESTPEIRARLEELRAVLRSESISYGELAELQSLAEHIEPGDVELLEAAGIPEREAALLAENPKNISRRAYLSEMVAKYDLSHLTDPDHPDFPGEPLNPVLAGYEACGEWLIVTETESCMYGYTYETRQAAIERGDRYINDDICSERPVVLINLDTKARQWPNIRATWSDA